MFAIFFFTKTLVASMLVVSYCKLGSYKDVIKTYSYFVMISYSIQTC